MPLTEMVNRVIRRGLDALRTKANKVARTYREKTFEMGEPRMGLEKSLALAAAIEDDEVLEKIARRK